MVTPVFTYREKKPLINGTEDMLSDNELTTKSVFAETIIRIRDELIKRLPRDESMTVDVWDCGVFTRVLFWHGDWQVCLVELMADDPKAWVSHHGLDDVMSRRKWSAKNFESKLARDSSRSLIETRRRFESHSAETKSKYGLSIENLSLLKSCIITDIGVISPSRRKGG